MTVSSLIKILKQLTPDALVQVPDGCGNSYTASEVEVTFGQDGEVRGVILR